MIARCTEYLAVYDPLSARRAQAERAARTGSRSFLPSLLGTIVALILAALLLPRGAAAQDVTAPQLTALSFPSTVNVSGGPATVKVNYSATDDSSGVFSFAISFKAPGLVCGSGGWVGASEEQTFVLGSVTSSVSFDLGQWVTPPGAYTVDGLLLTDGAGNFHSYTVSELQALGFPTQFTVVGTQDVTPPDLSFKFNFVDPADGVLAIDYWVGDGQSGASIVQLILTNYWGQRFSGSFTPDPSGKGTYYWTRLLGILDFGVTLAARACDAACNCGPQLVTGWRDLEVEAVTGEVFDTGGIVTTDLSGSGATPSGPMQTAVSSPNAGTISIAESASVGSAPSGYSFLSLQATIAAPPAAPANPLVVVFRIDPSQIPAGTDVNSIVVLKDNVPVAACTGPVGQASPDPCVADRSVLGDGEVQITVRTSSASLWQFAVNTCGNGVLDSGEQCDDGNVIGGDGCDSSCTIESRWTCSVPGHPCKPVCGDGVVLGSEQCDDGNLIDGDGCDSNCTVTGCGNGIVTAGEQCDDGNTDNTDACKNGCRLNGCGDGRATLLADSFDTEKGGLCALDYTGFANWTVARGAVNLIDYDCMRFSPGNGLYVDLQATSSGASRLESYATFTLTPGTYRLEFQLAGSPWFKNTVTVSLGTVFTEDFTLDSGVPFTPISRDIAVATATTGKLVFDHADNGAGGSGLLLDDIRLTRAYTCGNGVLEPGEQCDDGNLIDGDGCDSNCTVPGCGNCVLNAGEQCDDGNSSNNDACKTDCTPNVCGDGIVNPAAEQCDDGNSDNNDACKNDCTLNVCGDGYLNPAAEECDDGNLIDGDGCDSNCTVTRCGNGVTSAGEQCDDGNTSNEDWCKNDCTWNICGDGIVNQAGEQCDDGNTVDGDGCDSNCAVTGCGNGIVTAGEQCEDGNWNDNDACKNDCTWNVCGDGIVNPATEQCDDGNLVVGDGCDGQCMAEAGWTCPADGGPCQSDATVTPTQTPTDTPTTGALTSTPTQTVTATPTATSSLEAPDIALGTAVGRPGGVACVGATLAGNGAQVAGASNDISFDPNVFSVSGCAINPLIGAGTAPDKQLAMTVLGAGAERVGVFGVNLIPNGLLYSCTLAIGAGAGAGSYALGSVPGASDPDGTDITPVSGAPGAVTVTTCTGDCNGNGLVSIGEVVKCVNMFLGQPLCNPTNPTLGCPVADANLNGSVSIGEVIQCVNRFLNGCP